MTNKRKNALIGIQSVADRLEAWSEGERLAQFAAERRMDIPEADAHYNSWKNYRLLIDTLRAAIADLK
jgi:hypothetical protein